jgi:hypothetical protein
VSYEQKDNSGALFKNEDQREGRQDPLYKGSARINGVDYWVSAWLNTSKAGAKYMSLKYKAKDEARAPVQNDFDARYPSEAKPAVPPAPVAAADDLNDDVPF